MLLKILQVSIFMYCPTDTTPTLNFHFPRVELCEVWSDGGGDTSSLFDSSSGRDEGSMLGNSNSAEDEHKEQKPVVMWQDDSQRTWCCDVMCQERSNDDSWLMWRSDGVPLKHSIFTLVLHNETQRRRAGTSCIFPHVGTRESCHDV
jgi:hypothetical protein